MHSHTPAVIPWWSLLTVLCFLLSASCSKPAADRDDRETRAFLERYFSTWSAQDMEGYGSCFHPQARIVYLPDQGGAISQGLTDFLHGQKMAHQQAAVPMKERPLEMKIQGDGKVVQAVVTWELAKGNTLERGTDFFTLTREGNAWKIISLVFYGD